MDLWSPLRPELQGSLHRLGVLQDLELLQLAGLQKLPAFPLLDAAQRGRRVTQKIPGAQALPAGLGIGHGLPEADAAAAVPILPAQEFPKPVGGQVKGGDQDRVGIHGEAVQRLRNPLSLQVLRLHQERSRIDDEARPQVGANPWDEAAAAELREGVVTTVGGDHVVSGLGASVEAHDQVRTLVAHEEVDGGALSGVAEPEVDDRPALQGLVKPLIAWPTPLARSGDSPVFTKRASTVSRALPSHSATSAAAT